MLSRSTSAVPIRNEWFEESLKCGEFKEIPGSISLFNRHCKTFMRRVITFQKYDGEVYRVGCNSWICQVCGKRFYRAPEMM